MNKEESFSFWVPAQIVKSQKASESGKRWVQGIASTAAQDLQGEIVEQGGIDYNYLIGKGANNSGGYFNYNHQQGPDAIIGEPTECKITSKGLWVKGFLYQGKKLADDAWEHMQALDKSQARRKMGFSIEGRVLKRDGTTIKKCWLTAIALTPCPVNTTTWAEIAKSLSASPWDLNKSDDSEKSLSTASGAAIVPESLDEEEKENLDKGMTFEDLVSLLKSHGYSEADSENLSNYIFASSEQE